MSDNLHEHDRRYWTRLAADDRYLRNADFTSQFADIYRQGFLNLTESTISFDGTNTFTLTDAGAGWSYYRAGIKYTISGNKTVTLSATPPAATGHYHIWIDSTTGALSCGTGDWTLLDTKVPVAAVWWNNSLTPKYWMSDERHTVLIDQRMQYYLHAVSGVGFVSGATIAGQTINTDTNAAKTCSISETVLMDQDLRIVGTALSDPNGTDTDYVVAYRTAASTWAWKASNMPFIYNVGNTDDIIQWDDGGTMTNGGGGAGVNARWFNSYLLLTNLQGAARFLFVPGRQSFTSLALAQAEAVASFDWTGLEIAEMVIAYRFTWARNVTPAYTSQGKCVLAATPQRINVTITQTAGSGVGIDHNTLANLQGGAGSEYYHLTSAVHSALAVDASNYLTLTQLTTPTLYGSAAANGDITIEGTSNGTKATSYVVLQPTTGNVGIGVTAPTYKMHVAGTTALLYLAGNSSSAANPIFYMSDAATGYADFELYSDATNVMLGPYADKGIQFVGNVGAEVRMTLMNTGNVGIGTTGPGAKLQVQADGTGSGNEQFWISGATDSNKRLRIGYDTTNNYGMIQALTAGTAYNSLLISPFGGNVKIGGTASRGTTEGEGSLFIFNSTAPAGTLTNGISIYSSAGECWIMDAGGVATQQTPHDKEGRWHFNSKDTKTGKRTVIEVEKMMRFINDHFGLDYFHEYCVEEFTEEW